MNANEALVAFVAASFAGPPVISVSGAVAGQVRVDLVISSVSVGVRTVPAASELTSL